MKKCAGLAAGCGEKCRSARSPRLRHTDSLVNIQTGSGMYVPRHFEETDPTILQALIAAHPLGTWVTHTDGELNANHIPFMLDPHRGELGTLVAHVARANPVWSSLSAGVESLVIFQGGDAYISPSFYASKQVSGKVVPTWNYAVVHARGVARVVDDPAWLLRQLTSLTDIHESGMAAPWKVSDAPAGFVEGLLAAIVGIEIPLTALTGKWKVSQNRSVPDQLGIVAGLRNQNDTSSHDMAAEVARHT